MGIEKDFIKREVQKLTLLLSLLIEKVNGLNSNNSKSGIDEINEALKSEFDLTILKIAEIENSELLKYITELHESHIEKLTELIRVIVLKIDLLDLQYNKKEIAKKGILLIDFLNKNSNVFSMERMNIKNALQQQL